ncbi:zeta toxin family protein [Tundrisphaera lichenicola]|uniref:zeta toxin family protein n=1 Tax=Tundrisphaera lichenicola TaxID=2029860 RepID=UPI003EBFD304
MMSNPLFIVIAGPNGAGKSTAAAHLLPSNIAFLNADEIAKQLPNYPSGAADIRAGRLVLERMKKLEQIGSDIAVETTLASRSLAARIARLKTFGYLFHLTFTFLPDPDMAVLRVASRVRLGGHDIPEETIRRRYQAGLSNLFELYLPLADRWFVLDTTRPAPLRLIAEGIIGEPERVIDPTIWRIMKRSQGHAR